MKKIQLAIIAASFVLAAHAQNGINTPYSRYGFGIQSERAMGFNKGMGGIAQGFRNGREINIANPASYSAADSLTAIFDLGLSLQNSNHKMGGLQQNVRNSNFDYFAFQFRAFKNVGMTIGLMPISNINYNFSSSEESLAGTENVTTSYKFNGDGGLREVFFGTGWRPFKPISIGFNARYVWGDYTHNTGMTFSDNTSFNLARTYTGEVNTYSVQGGLQLIQPLNKKDKIVLGATYTYGHKVGGEATRTTQTLNSSSVEETTSDTIKHAFQLPHAISAGVTFYHADNLRVGVDFELQKWAECRFPNQTTGISSSTISEAYASTTGQLNDRTKWSAGLDWTPEPGGRRFFKRCTYKVGGYYAQTYAKADPTGTIADKPYEFGVSAGITMPVGNQHTMWGNIAPRLNMALQWTHTDIPYLNAATMQKGTLNENYLRLCIGVTFCERWFYKWKVK